MIWIKFQVTWGQSRSWRASFITLRIHSSKRNLFCITGHLVWFVIFFHYHLHSILLRFDLLCQIILIIINKSIWIEKILKLRIDQKRQNPMKIGFLLTFYKFYIHIIYLESEILEKDLKIWWSFKDNLNITWARFY